MNIYVDRASRQWVARDHEGNLWILPPNDIPWDDRRPYSPAEETELSSKAERRPTSGPRSRSGPTPGDRTLTHGSEGEIVFRSILVPLDCSSFAEQALPLALRIARQARARLDLVTVHVSYDLEERIPVGAHLDPKRDDERKQKEQSHLAAARAAEPGVSGSTAVLPGSAVLPETVADSILERVCAEKIDLIVMATHARGALGRLIASGSVADELIRRANVPVLLVRPDLPASGFVPDQVLIALDGSAVAEQVLEPALNVAHLLQVPCILLRVVESRSAADDQLASRPPEVSQAEEYLARVAAKVCSQGLQVGTRVVVAHDAAEAVLAEAEAQGCNLVALAAQGRSRLGRLLFGSVAEKIVLGVRSPMLAYRPAGTPA